MTFEPQPGFTGIFIPVEILEMDDLSPNEVILLSWIAALSSNEKGACFASNEYLSRKLKVKENTIAKSISNLRKKGLIEDVSFDGRVRMMRSLHYRKADEIQTKKTIQTRVGKKSNPPLEKNPSPSLYIDIKEERKDMSPPAPKHTSKSSKDEKILHFGEFESVLLTRAEYDRLVNQYGKELVDNTIESMDLIAADLKEKTFRNRYSIKSPTYNLALRRWIKRGSQEGWNNKPKNPEKTNEEYAKEVAANFSQQKAPSMKIEIEATSTGLRIMSLYPTSRMEPTLIPYTEKGFKEQVNNALRRWKLL